MLKPDAQLVRECLSGNRDAFGFLVDRYKGAVYALAYHRVHDAMDAEDVAQEAFTRAYEKLPSLQNPHCFASWLYTLTVRCALNWSRKHHRDRRTTSSLEVVEEDALHDAAVNTYREASLSNKLHVAIETLPEPQRLPLIMFYLGGFSAKETADFLGVSHGSVRVRLHRARQRLREEFTNMLESSFATIQLDSQFTIRIMERVQSYRLQRPIPVLPPLLKVGTLLASLAFLFAGIFGLPDWVSLTPAQFGTDAPMEAQLLSTDVSPVGQSAMMPPAPAPPSSEESHSLIQFVDSDGSEWGTAASGSATYERYWQRLQEQETTTLSGQVVHDGQPVPDTTVYLFPWLGSVHRLRLVTRTDERGFFQFENLPITRYKRVRFQLQNLPTSLHIPDREFGYLLQAYDLIAYAPEYAISIKHIRELHKPTTLRLEMPDSQTLSGTVRNEAGQPIADATMQVVYCQQTLYPHIPGIRPATQETVSFSGVLSAKTDVDGRFRMGNLPGNVRLRLVGNAVGYGDVAKRWSDGEECEVTMNPAATVRGTVCFEDEQPASGVEIRAGKRTVQTDTQGFYEFTGLPTGTLLHVLPLQTSDAGSDNWIPAERNQVMFRPGQTIQMDILLLCAALVSGRVTDAETGEPIPGVGVECKDESLLSPDTIALTDGNGRYTVRVIPGYIRVEAEYPRHGGATSGPEHRRTLHLEAGEHATDVNFQFDKGMGVSGIVLRPDGEPAVGAMVFDRLDRFRLFLHEQAEPHAITDEQGLFTIPSLLKGSASQMTSLIVSHPSEDWCAFTRVHAGEDNVIQLEPYRSTSVNGRVLDEQQRPIPNARVMIHHLDGGWYARPGSRTDSAGGFELRHVVVGNRYRVVAKVPGMPEAVSPEFVTTSKPIHLADTIIHPAPRHPTALLGGIVVDPSGNPIKDIWITATTELQQTGTQGQSSNGTERERHISASVQSDTQGRFRLNSVVGQRVDLNCVTGGHLRLLLRNVPTGRSDIRVVMPSQADAAVSREWSE